MRCNFQPRRRGAVLVVVLVCLAMATAMSLVVVRQIAAERRAAQMNQRSLQALWLAEAGVERAAARLAADPKYAGETWLIPAKELAAGDGAVVRIEVETIAGRPQRRSVRVEADYADAADCHSRQVKQIVVDRDAILSRQPTKALQLRPPRQMEVLYARRDFRFADRAAGEPGGQPFVFSPPVASRLWNCSW